MIGHTTEHENGRKTRQLDVPVWALELLKVTSPAIVAIAVLYARFMGVEKTSEDNKTKIEARTEVLNAVDRRVATMEVKQGIMERDMLAALTRIETTIKDVQTDVKELQKNRPK
jgi:hypothetical protein